MHEYRQIFKDEGTLLFVILVPLLYPVLYSWIYNNEVVEGGARGCSRLFAQRNGKRVCAPL